MRLNQAVSLLLAAGPILISTLLGAVSYAQDAPAPLPASQSPAPARKPAVAAKPAKPPKPHPQQQRPMPDQGAGTSAPTFGAPASGAAAPVAGAGSPAAPQTVFDEHARQGKIATCANVFSVLGRGVVVDSSYTAQTQWAANAGDTHAVESLVALSGSGEHAAQRAAGVIFAAPVGQKCEGGLVRVTPTASSCEALGAELAKQNGRSRTLGDLSVIDLPNGAQVMLVPFNNACIAVTTLRASG
ncbi:hypothetical protein SAMN05519103_06638 [Rhizobiales bacterium GAS113]|nr:hypothetical protein SAMN05519103_06638 [Rhizobiales bacterium GAS113]